MTDIQPDLFGELDAREERDRQDRLPQTCPCCGTTEPNLLLLITNHGGWWDGEPPGRYTDGLCVAQWLTVNHITYDVQTGHDDALARSVARGRELGLDVDRIIAEAGQGDHG